MSPLTEMIIWFGVMAANFIFLIVLVVVIRREK